MIFFMYFFKRSRSYITREMLKCWITLASSSNLGWNRWYSNNSPLRKKTVYPWPSLEQNHLAFVRWDVVIDIPTILPSNIGPCTRDLPTSEFILHGSHISQKPNPQSNIVFVELSMNNNGSFLHEQWLFQNFRWMRLR